MRIYVIDTQSNNDFYLVYLGEVSDEPFYKVGKYNPLENVVKFYEDKDAIVKVI